MATEASSGGSESRDWRDVLQGDDKEAFEAIVAPHIDTLREAARRDLSYYTSQGFLNDNDLTPEEVVGETLLYAWAHRKQRPGPMSLRNYLLSVQYRVTRGLIDQVREYRSNKRLSLEAPIPSDPERDPAKYQLQEWFYQWYQPDAVTLWEEVIPSYEPVDVEVPLDTTSETFTTDPDTYHVMMLHLEFEMDLPDVAFAMGRNVHDVAELLTQARAHLRRYTGSTKDE